MPFHREDSYNSVGCDWCTVSLCDRLCSGGGCCTEEAPEKKMLFSKETRLFERAEAFCGLNSLGFSVGRSAKVSSRGLLVTHLLDIY